MQSSVYIRRLASGRARKQGGEPEAAKMGMLKKFTRGLGHSFVPNRDNWRVCCAGYNDRSSRESDTLRTVGVVEKK
ncbi:hypothetical protein SASPL_157907 [Salvia splendens]|uniref:Uncharacterized protein n=1 Tax=Salvia splendens TaxID=180675 RepID=A0A8X8YUR5_SALSN|nr:hypothetical protein SASPL_157907 [Salvia splendens]